MDYARFAPTIAVIYGGAGVGKTTALRHYAKTRPRTWLVTAAVARKTTSAILMALVESPGLRGFAYRVDSLYSEALVLMGRSRDDEANGLLIIDEAQHLETPAFDAIRAFHDEAKIGIAYAGNEEVYSRIHGKKRSRLPQNLFPGGLAGQDRELHPGRYGSLHRSPWHHGKGGTEILPGHRRIAGRLARREPRSLLRQIAGAGDGGSSLDFGIVGISMIFF